MKMPRVELNPGLSLSRRAYGVWRLSEAADTSAQAVAGRIQACLDQGITTFDHADIYGGYSPPALELCGAHCDVYLMWPETREILAQRMRDVHARAAHYGRVLDYGLRIHMIVRDTEAEAREYARELVSQLVDE